jgi:hexosaminidase
MKKLTLVFLVCLVHISLVAQKLNIIPAPVSAKINSGNFILSAKTKIVLNDSGEKFSADFLNDYLQKIYGFKLEISNDEKENFIRFNTLRFIQKPENEGHYTLNIKEDNINIEGDSYQGTFYGMQSLLQLFPGKAEKQFSIPCAAVNDYPRFAYRGLHLDVARHFFPVEFVKKYIDYIALHKMNTFHWHLTDDQGWRIEIKKFPELLTTAAYRNGTIIGRYPGKGNDGIRYGGYYTQEEIKDVVKYAAERYITVIPEIEMPGHASAAIAAYPELSCFPDEPTKAPAQTAWSGPKTGKQVQQAWGVFPDVFCAGNENTFKFLEGVIDEVLELFPSTYVHIGGDESPKDNWKRCSKCQQIIKDNKLKDEHELQSYFIQRMEKYINSKGRQIIGWDEILEGGLAPNATVMSWQGEKGGIEAAKQKHNVIMTPGNYMYLDHSQSKYEDSVTIGGFTPLEEVYSYEPIPKELTAEQGKYILGAQGNVWTEYMKNTKKVEYQILPRISALSEILWSPKESRNYIDFEKRMPKQFNRYELWGANYSKAYYNIKASITPTKNNDGIMWTLESKSQGNIFVSNKKTNSGLKYAEPLMINGSGELEAAVVEDKKVISTLKQSFLFNKATGRTITLTTPPSTTYPGNGGAFGLVNATTSDRGFNSPEWFGWLDKDMEAVIDLGTSQPVTTVAINVWKQEPSYIYLPKSVVVYTSSNGKDWTQPSTENPVNNTWINERKITVALPSNTNARFIKVVATNLGTIPEGKPGAGRKAWLFVDEIEVE